MFLVRLEIGITQYVGGRIHKQPWPISPVYIHIHTYPVESTMKSTLSIALRLQNIKGHIEGLRCLLFQAA